MEISLCNFLEKQVPTDDIKRFRNVDTEEARAIRRLALIEAPGYRSDQGHQSRDGGAPRPETVLIWIWFE